MAWKTNYYSPIPSPLHSPIPLSSSFPWSRSFHGEDHMHDQNHLLIITIVIASTAGAMIFLITLSKILRYYHYSRRSYLNRTNPPILFDIRGDSPFSDDEEHEQVIRHPIWFISSRGLQQSIIDSITICKYRENEGLVKETECLVCLGEFQQEESLRLLPKCNHAFHVSCIDTWLRSHKNCPLCRAPIVHDAASVGVSTEPDSNSSVSDMNEDIEESESGGVRVGDEEYSCEEVRDDGIHVLIECAEMSDHSSIVMGSASDVSAQEFEGELREAMKRSVSMDSSFASREFCDVLDLNFDIESLDTNTNLGDEKKVSISSNKDIAIDKQGRESSTNYKQIGQRHFSMRSSSHNTKFIFSSCSRSQSSTLPL